MRTPTGIPADSKLDWLGVLPESTTGRSKKEEQRGTDPKDQPSRSPQSTPPNPPKNGGAAREKVCPRCSAQPGEACRDRSGRTRADHPARLAGKPTFKQRIEWCQANVPEQHPLFAAVAHMMIDGQGKQPTPELVRERLVATERDVGSL